jgi:hypothetical protein
MRIASLLSRKRWWTLAQGDRSSGVHLLNAAIAPILPFNPTASDRGVRRKRMRNEGQLATNDVTRISPLSRKSLFLRFWAVRVSYHTGISRRS